MDRKTFIHQCGLGCLGLLGLSALTQSCGSTKAVSGQINGKQMSIPLSSFRSGAAELAGFRRYLVVRNPTLNYPLIVYRDSDSSYTALLLRCSHQYAELSVNGDLLTCAAHGSEFNTKGEVVSGPASARLRQFPTKTEGDNLYIDLS